MPDMYTEYRTTEDGGIIDPPIIPDYERQLTEASALGDQTLIASITESYHDDRKELAERHNKAVRERRAEDDELLAKRQRDHEDQARQRADAAAENERRERADAARRAEELRQRTAGLGGSELPAPGGES